MIQYKKYANKGSRNVEEEVVVLYRCNKSTQKRACPCCEAENETDESFCFFCGTALTQTAVIRTGPTEKPDNSWKWIVGIVAAAVVATIALIAIAMN